MTTEVSQVRRVVMPWMRKRKRKPVPERESKVVKRGLNEEQAEQIVASINMKAQQEAEDEAARIVSQAKQEAEELKRDAEATAQKEAKDKAAKIVSQAKQEAEELRRDAEAIAQKEAKDEATKEKIEEPAQLQAEATKEKVEEPAQLQAEATEEKVEEPAQLKQHSQTLYAGEVELAIAKPVDPKMVSKLYAYLQTTPEIKLVHASGSWERGTTITVVLDKPIPLISVISSKIPEAEVTPERPERNGFVTGKRGVRRIKLALKEV